MSFLIPTVDRLNPSPPKKPWFLMRLPQKNPTERGCNLFLSFRGGGFCKFVATLHFDSEKNQGIDRIWLREGEALCKPRIKPGFMGAGGEGGGREPKQAPNKALLRA